MADECHGPPVLQCDGAEIPVVDSAEKIACPTPGNVAMFVVDQGGRKQTLCVKYSDGRVEHIAGYDGP